MKLGKNILPRELVIGSVDHFADVAGRGDEKITVMVADVEVGDYFVGAGKKVGKTFTTFGLQDVIDSFCD